MEWGCFNHSNVYGCGSVLFQKDMNLLVTDCFNFYHSMHGWTAITRHGVTRKEEGNDKRK